MKHKGEMPKDPREVNPQIPEDLSLLILKCLEKKKEDRYPGAEYVFSELSKIEQRIPTTERIKPKRKPITSKEITVTFGVKKLLIPALIVVILVIAALIILKFLPKKEAVLAPKIENSIAVISFENQTGDEAYDYLQKVIPNLLITNLENTGLLYVVTWERMRDILEQIGKKDVEIIDKDLGFEVCRREGIEAIVLGFFTKAGEVFHTDIKVLDAETKDILKSHISRGDGVDSILKIQIDELSKEISQGVGIARQKIEASQARIADVTTNSMEAYNYFLMGKEVYEDREDYYGAQQFLEKAVELDPTFASAYFWLAWIYMEVGDVNAYNEAFEKAKLFSEKATEKERLFIEAEYADYIENDYEKTFRILKEIIKKFPKEKFAYYQLGVYYSNNNSYQEAIEEFNKSYQLDPNYGWALAGLAATYRKMGDYEKAIECFEKWASISPENALPLHRMAYVYFRRGEFDKVLEKEKEALDRDPDSIDSLIAISYMLALKEDYLGAMKWANQIIERAKFSVFKIKGYILRGFYHYWLGNLNKSMEDLQEADKLFQELGKGEERVSIAYIKLLICYDRGLLELSRKYYKEWTNIRRNSPTLLSLYGVSYFQAWMNIHFASLDLKEGRIDSAKSKFDELKSIIPKIKRKITQDFVSYFSDFLSAEIQLQDRNPDKSISILENKSLKIIMGFSNPGELFGQNMRFLNDVLARAYLQKGEIDKAIEEYERLITLDPKSGEKLLIYPKYYYKLAKLYEQKGWEGKAIENYEKFLDLWKDADPGIAEVEDAKKRLAALQTQ
jgi:tetratricopeptide (TPR) repeat protein